MARLTREGVNDPAARAEVAAYFQEKPAIIHAHDTVDAGTGNINHRFALSLNSRKPAPHQTSSSHADRVAMLHREQTLSKSHKAIKECERELDHVERVRTGLFEFLVQQCHAFAALRSTKHSSHSKATAHATAMAQLREFAPDLSEKYANTMDPVTVTGGIVKSFFNTVRFATGTCPFPAPVQHLAQAVYGKSGSAYRQLASAGDGIFPAASTVTEYRHTVYYKDGSNAHLIKAVFDQGLVQPMSSRSASGQISLRHVITEYDTMTISRVRTHNDAWFSGLFSVPPRQHGVSYRRCVAGHSVQ